MRQNCIDTIETQAAPQASWGQWAQAGVALIKADCLQLVLLLWSWHERSRQRFKLQTLSDETLKDVGLSRADIEHESSKPFWEK